jgi:hypothetical protein
MLSDIRITKLLPNLYKGLGMKEQGGFVEQLIPLIPEQNPTLITDVLKLE